MLDQSPLHAWHEHARLNPEHEREEAEKLDIGTAAHGLLLEGETGVVVLDFPDFRTKEARAQRDAARAAGKVPVLKDRWADVVAMAEAVKVQLARHERPIPLTGGKPEVTLIWREGDVWCRARPDWLHNGRPLFVDDLKTTQGSANPDGWTRGPLFDRGYDLQAAFYLRGLLVLFGVEATFRFVVAETTPPYACSVIGLSPDVLVLGEKKRRLAVELWGECLRTNRWPGYPTRTCYATLPPWEEARWLERELREDPVAVIGGRAVDDGQRDIAEVL
jgi:hypothetical protein